MRAHARDAMCASSCRRRELRGRAALRPRPARPAMHGPRHAQRAPRPALARAARGRRQARRAPADDARPRRGRSCAPAAASSTRSARSRRARNACRARTSGAPSRRRITPTVSIVPPMEAEAGLACPLCREPWLRPTALPGRYRCSGCLHRFELRSVCPGCGEHSDDRADVEHLDDQVLALLDLHARRDLTSISLRPQRASSSTPDAARDRTLRPGRRLRAPARAGRGGQRAPART